MLMLMFPLCFQRPDFCSDAVYGMSRLRLGGETRRGGAGRILVYVSDLWLTRCVIGRHK